MLTVFVSYAREDPASASRIARNLRRSGVSVWFDTSHLKGGDDWRLEIKRGIESADFVIALLSTNSVSKDGYVQKELRIAFEQMDLKPPGRRFIIPVRLDSCETRDPRIDALHRINFFTSPRRAMQELRASLELRTKVRRAAGRLARQSDIALAERDVAGKPTISPDQRSVTAEPRKPIKTTINLTEESVKVLRALSAERGTSLAEVIRRTLSLERYLSLGMPRKDINVVDKSQRTFEISH